MTLATLVIVGSLSAYSPGDGHNSGTLACGGTLTHASRHVAIRQWRGRCGAVAVVCAAATMRCVRTVVMDSGPWGAVPDEQAAQPETLPREFGSRSGGPRAHRVHRAWQVQVRLRPGWRRRAIADLAPALWRELGRPAFLSPIVVWVQEVTR